MQFKEIQVSDLQMNPMTLIGKEWMLVTAGDESGYNTMTASWGHLGTLWNLPTSTIFVRPQRYTKEFVDREPLYSLTFFPEAHKKALGYLGSHSGRDEDKVAKVGFTPVFEDGFTYFAEANLVLVCRKLYSQFLSKDGFEDPALYSKNYPIDDLHKMYIGEITDVLVKD